MHPKVPGALYLDIATVVLAGNASINFELPIQDNTLLRVGLGRGYLARFDRGTVQSSGVITMVNFVTSGSDHRFEIGAGGSIVWIDSYNVGVLGIRREDPGFIALPAFLLGYRYHPYSGGFLFRFGLGYTYAFGAPLYVSVGSTL